MKLYVNEHPELLDLHEVLPQLSDERRRKALRFRFELDQKLSAAVYLLLKDALREEYGITEDPVLAIAEYGKPYLRDHPGIFFNFSHCPKAAVCAIDTQPIGVDVERIASVDPAVAQRVLSAGERERVEASTDSAEAFAVLWTKKEALLKLRGSGIAQADLPRLLEGASKTHFMTRVSRDGGYVLTVASPAE